MSTDGAKIRARLAKLARSLDELESQLDPLLAQSLPETLLALDTLQQAKLQTVIPYVVYDLAFVYLKSRGIDPKTHRVVAELERVRQYFDKIARAEESDRKRTLGVDKAAATRFIKHAIAQAKNAQLVDDPSDAPPAAGTSTNPERVPIKVTSKMLARAEYEKQLEVLGSEEEDDLEVFDDGDAMDTIDGPSENVKPVSLDKGKGRAEEFNVEQLPPSKCKRPRVDPFSGYAEPTTDKGEKPELSTPPSADDASRGTSVPTSGDREAGKATKKMKRKAKKPRNL